MVRFTPEATAEIAEARAWYEQRQTGRGRDFTAAVNATLNRVEQLPLSFPIVRGETRRAAIRRFPYLLFYRVDSTGVVVVGCFHGARHPHVWLERLQ